MTDMRINLANFDLSRVAKLPRPQRLQVLRQAVDEVVGATFFAPMLKAARSSAIRSKVFHGGRGEEVFGAQLDAELARRASMGMHNGLNDTLFRRWSGRV